MRLVLLSIVLFVGMAQSQEPRQTPQVATEKESNGPLKGEEKSTAKAKDAKETVIGIKGSYPETSKNKAQNNAHQGSDETSEFWFVFGRRLKVTDSLLVVFTFLLFIATILLWWSTRRLVKGADKNAERQLRAYVSHEAFDLRVEAPDCVIQRFIFTPRFKNTGATPARSCEIWSDITLEKKQDPIPTIQKEGRHPEGSSGSIGANQFSQGRALGVSWDDVQAILEGQSRLFLWTIVEYMDVFDHPRHTQAFCEVEMKFGIDRRLDPDKPRDPFRYRRVGKQNTED